MASNPIQRRAETLDYIQSMLGQLRFMAEGERCDMLAFLIEMAFLEAGDIMAAEQLSSVGQQRNSAA